MPSPALAHQPDAVTHGWSTMPHRVSNPLRSPRQVAKLSPPMAYRSSSPLHRFFFHRPSTGEKLPVQGTDRVRSDMWRAEHVTLPVRRVAAMRGEADGHHSIRKCNGSVHAIASDGADMDFIPGLPLPRCDCCEIGADGCFIPPSRMAPGWSSIRGRTGAVLMPPLATWELLRGRR